MGEAAALSQPPRCLTQFLTQGAMDLRADVIFTDWSIRCRYCEAERFVLSELSRDEPNSYGVGISARCVACGAGEQIFDAAHDGYDGELGHNEYLQGPRKAAPLVDQRGNPVPAGRVKVAFTYNTDLAELAAIGAEHKLAPRDLFDWFNLEISEAGDEWRRVWDFECA